MLAAKRRIISQLARENDCDVVVLQETHSRPNSVIDIDIFTVASSTISRTQGLATYVRDGVPFTSSDSYIGASLQWCSTCVDGFTIINVYKSPAFRLDISELPEPPATGPFVLAGDFNTHARDWGYDETTEEGERLLDWLDANGLISLYDPKEVPSFESARWRTMSTPDLTFVRNCPSTISRLTLDRFPRSQHRPLLITSESLPPPQSVPKKRWNLQKANWALFAILSDRLAANLPDPNGADVSAAYDAWCLAIRKAAAGSVPRGYRAQRQVGWDSECTRLYDAFRQTGDRIEAKELADRLISHLDTTRKSAWKMSCADIDFTHSSRVAWQTINRLTGRSTRRQECLVSASAIAHRLVENGKFPVGPDTR